ncbi:MAG: AAA family ATPase [Rhodobacteraceae bacterium]|nr:MAG: AAA family ATPase [Paracoccaceae bacterium]
MQFPYGISDFATLIREGYFYQDRTDRIPLLEATGRQLVFIRPRRFGKSLLLSMLEHYYDLNRADEFDALFGGLAIGQKPTPLRNQYLILRWDFSLIQAQGEIRDIEAAVHRYLNQRLAAFADDYARYLSHAIHLHADDAIVSLQSVLHATRASGHKIYLLIDEYDNFANEVLMHGGRKDHYESLLYGEGLLKTVFKAVKAGASGQGIDRVFITGVSPIVLGDITSGYNVAENVYLNQSLNDLCGFTEAEIHAVLTQLAAEGKSWSIAEALNTMRTFYNGYRFSSKAQQAIYNPTLSLYFLKHLYTVGEYPEIMLDDNLSMDQAKLRYIAGLPGGEQLLTQALSTPDGVVIPSLAQRFGLADMLSARKDDAFMASLLYFFGILTLNGTAIFKQPVLSIPNLVARSLYVERLQELWLPDVNDMADLRRIAQDVYLSGEIAPLCQFIEQRYFPMLSNRDYRWTNELLLKVAFMTVLFNDRIYMMVSETEVDHGYVDLSLIVRPDMRRFQALDLLLEFKYVSLKALDLSGEQLKAKTIAELEALPAVAAKLDEATAQAQRYAAVLQQRYGLSELHHFAVVGVGLERVVFRRVL